MTSREKLREILLKHGITQARCAAIICEYTMRPCSVRTVRSWLNDPTKTSARQCPDWVIAVLTNALLRLNNRS